MLSKVNVFEVDVDFANKKNPEEEGCSPEWINIDNAIEMLPLPYHKKALEYYIERNGLSRKIGK